jgi:hypothetical protein
MKKPLEIIDQLSPEDALSVLRTLAGDSEQIAGRIAEIAIDYLSEVDPEEEAGVLYDELDHLEVEEVWDRAGSTRHGYVEPHEAAYEMVGEVFEPYLEQLKKYHKLGMNTEANRLCMGLLLGLYEFERDSTSEFKNWAPEASSEFAWEVVEVWKTGSPSRADIATIRAFVEEELGGWQVKLLK